MEGFYGWIRNIVCYLIFVTIITNLLPSGKYEKYLRLFSGCVLILLVIQPLTGSLRLEEQIAALFHSFSFEYDVGELGPELEDMEERRVEVLVGQYEAAASEDIARLAALEGLETRQVSVEIEGDKDSPDFGKMRRVTVILKEIGAETAGVSEADDETPGHSTRQGEYGEDEEVKAVELVNPVNIQIELYEGDTEEEGRTPEGMIQGEEEPASSYLGAGAARGTGAWKLRQEIAGCYQMEEKNVEIRLENE